MNKLQFTILLLVTTVATTGHALEKKKDDLEWETEAGFLSGYHDNYFYRGESPTPDETFLTVYALGDLVYDLGPGDLLVEAGTSAAFGLTIDQTDFQTVQAGIGYKSGRTKSMLSYRRTFDKVFGEEDDASLFDVDSLQGSVRQKFTNSLRGLLAFQFQNWNFSSPDNDRDAFRYQPKARLRWEISKFFALRSAFFWTWKDADSGRYDYNGPGIALAAEIKPTDSVDVFLRYRHRWRDYGNAPSGDSNFKRNDNIDDVIANARWRLTDFFGLRLEGSYRHGNSTRSDRNYDAFTVTGGFFVAFAGSR